MCNEMCKEMPRSPQITLHILKLGLTVNFVSVFTLHYLSFYCYTTLSFLFFLANVLNLCIIAYN